MSEFLALVMIYHCCHTCYA